MLTAGVGREGEACHWAQSFYKKYLNFKIKLLILPIKTCKLSPASEKGIKGMTELNGLAVTYLNKHTFHYYSKKKLKTVRHKSLSAKEKRCSGFMVYFANSCIFYMLLWHGSWFGKTENILAVHIYPPVLFHPHPTPPAQIFKKPKSFITRSVEKEKLTICQLFFFPLAWARRLCILGSSR